MHKNIGPDNPKCLSCEKFLPDLSFVLQDFMLWVWQNHSNCHISEGWRNQEKQHQYFLDGKSKQDWPYSKHNNMENKAPFSLAIDLFILDEKGEAQFPLSFYQDLYHNAVLMNQPITWGGLWVDFPDSDHFEIMT